MRPPDPNAPSGAAASTRLNGWKEIAVYLGRGVRTIQRWEKVFGLPIHRLGSGRGDVVHAFAQELDAWLKTAGRTYDLSESPAAADANGAQGAEGSADQGEDGDLVAESGEPIATGTTGGAPATTWFRRVEPWAGAALVILLAVAAFAGWAAWRRGDSRRPSDRGEALPRQPSTASVDVETLRAFDADRRLLWSHRFPWPLGSPTAGRPEGASGRIVVTDIDGDGRREVLLFVPLDVSGWLGQLVCFDDVGRLKWSRRPTRSIRFGDRDYHPPWRGLAFFLTGDGRKTQLWAAWSHHESGEFPCLLERLSAAGQPESEFWSAGFIATVMRFVVDGRASIFVGAVNNDSQGASLAVFDEDNVQGAAPARSADKVCRNGPPGSPRVFLVFPRMELARLEPGYPCVVDIRQSDAGEFRLWVEQPGIEPHPTVAYRLGADFTPHSAEIGPDYIAAHRTLERDRKVDHPFGDRDRAEAWPVLVWKDGRFVPVTGVDER